MSPLQLKVDGDLQASRPACNVYLQKESEHRITDKKGSFATAAIGPQ